MPDEASRPSTVSVSTFRDDALYPKVERVVAAILAKGKAVTPIDVLVGMGLLTPDQLEDWQCGRVPYLERVINSNLTRLSRLLRILRFHAHDLRLKPSATAYMRRGRGLRQPLRFTKTGDARLEEIYSTHFVRVRKGSSHPPASRSSEDETPGR